TRRGSDRGVVLHHLPRRLCQVYHVPERDAARSFAGGYDHIRWCGGRREPPPGGFSSLFGGAGAWGFWFRVLLRLGVSVLRVLRLYLCVLGLLSLGSRVFIILGPGRLSLGSRVLIILGPGRLSLGSRVLIILGPGRLSLGSRVLTILSSGPLILPALGRRR